MSKHVFFIIFSSLLISTMAAAQMKTMQLDEIVVEGLPFEKFVSGSKLERSDSLQMATMGQGTLADYMQQNTTVYIKEQGNRMLASVSFRGTGSSHTGVFWHGINLNSLTLGNTDFNGVPLFLFDDILVQYGGASSLHGSDAIGGSIHLSSGNKWTKGANIQIKQDFGSFGNVFTGVKVDVGNGKWESKTRIFNQLLKNNFSYSFTDRIGGQYSIKQENAELHNYGLLQEFNGKIANNGVLSIKGWAGNNYHQIQPMTVSSPDQDQLGDEIKDKNVRLLAEYEHFFKKGTLLSSVGYVWDYQIFNNSDVIETKRISANMSYEWNFNDKTSLRAGGNGQYIIPRVWSYDEDLTEWRGDIFVSLNQVILKNWQVNVNARQTYVPFTSAPIAPSLSTSYLLELSEISMNFRAQVERSYRVPTFNDRYWGEQGRPDLRAENGYSLELGHNLEWGRSDFLVDFDIAGYYMIVDDWIAWKPAGNLWRPYNLKKVEASGVELNGKFTWKIPHGEFNAGGMYAYNRSLLLEGVSEDDPAVGYQLPYTPKHRAGINTSVIYHEFRIGMNFGYTGIRNGIDVIHEEVEGFLLTDLSLSKRLSIGKQLMSIEGQVLNLFDIDYQNVNRYAMPGRNYLISLNFFINNQLK